MVRRKPNHDVGLERHSYLPLHPPPLHPPPFTLPPSPFPLHPPSLHPPTLHPSPLHPPTLHPPTLHPPPLPSLPPSFNTECRASLIGVGILTKDERGLLTLEKEATSIARFLNRILGLSVRLQNKLFAYFSDTLGQIIQQARRMGRWDGGILGLGLCGTCGCGSLFCLKLTVVPFQILGQLASMWRW